MEEKVQDIEKLGSLIESNDWDAVQLASQIGTPAREILDRSRVSPDEETRSLSIACLSEIHEGEGISVFLEALSDSVLDVRIQAVLAVEKHATMTHVQPLLEYFEQEEEDTLRERAILLVGRLGGPESVPQLVELRSSEKDPEVRGRIDWALARLDHEESTKAILSSLESSNELTRYDAIQGIEYIDRASLAKRLLPLLDDATDIEPEGPAHLGRYRRISDVVVSVVAATTRKDFSFDTTEKRKFSEPEIEEVRGYLESLK